MYMVRNGEAIVAWARSKVGIEENPRGSNSGQALESMLKETNFTPGNAWCMFFCEAVLKAVFHPTEAIPAWIVHTGSCADQAHKAMLLGRTSEWPATGCIVLFRGGPRGFHHAGIVSEVTSSGTSFRSVEGNTNSDGSVEGYAVCEHTHTRTDQVFVIW